MPSPCPRPTRRRPSAVVRPGHRSTTTRFAAARLNRARCPAFTRRAKHVLTRSGRIRYRGDQPAINPWRACAGRGSHRPPVAGRSSRGHALCAAYGSGLQSAAVLTIDGLGDGFSATTSLFRDGAADTRCASPRPLIRWGLLRARHHAAEHARAGGRRQGDGALGYASPVAGRRQSAARARDGRGRTDPLCADGGRPRAPAPANSLGAIRTSSSRIWRRGRSSTSAPSWPAMPSATSRSRSWRLPAAWRRTSKRRD